MNNRPIGIYDSGIGGLTGLKALRRLLPGEDLVFFADDFLAIGGLQAIAEHGLKAPEDL